jgi:hypothetical protein
MNRYYYKLKNQSFTAGLSQDIYRVYHKSVSDLFFLNKDKKKGNLFKHFYFIVYLIKFIINIVIIVVASL